MSTELQVSQPRQVAKPQGAMSLFQPTSFHEAWEFAKVLADSGMVPKAYVGKPAAIISTWQLSTELNVGLMQGLQGVSNINGTPAVFGDLGWALVQNHPDFVDAIEDITDTQATCTLKRRGRTDVTRKYSLDAAKVAGLLGKDNWKNHPRRMLQWRARSWAMRDLFADALKGMVIYEEAQDFASDTPEQPKIQATIVVPNDKALATPAEGQQPAQEQATAAQEEDAGEKVIEREEAVKYFQAYSANKWLKEESLAFLQTFNPPYASSLVIKRKDYDKAMAWANSSRQQPEMTQNPDSEPPQEWTGELPQD